MLNLILFSFVASDTYWIMNLRHAEGCILGVWSLSSVLVNYNIAMHQTERTFKVS